MCPDLLLRLKTLLAIPVGDLFLEVDSFFDPKEYNIGDIDPLPDFNIIEEEYIVFERIDEPLAILDIIGDKYV